MNDNAKKWVEALRSGNIEQTKYILADPNGSRCCLGVACDLAVEAGVIPTPIETTSLGKDMQEVPALKYDGIATAVLLDSVVDWLGLRHNDGQIGDLPDDLNEQYEDLPSLAMLNDQGMSFEEIANVIEAEKELFNA